MRDARRDPGGEEGRSWENSAIGIRCAVELIVLHIGDIPGLLIILGLCKLGTGGGAGGADIRRIGTISTAFLKA